MNTFCGLHTDDFFISISLSGEVCIDNFLIESQSGTIRTSGVLDREAITTRQSGNDRVTCFVQYTDDAGISRILSVNIDVLDVNDEVPRLFELAQPHRVEIGENSRPPARLVRLQVVDNDNGVNGTVNLTFLSGNASLFEISTPDGARSPELTILQELDFERDLHMYNVTIRLTDGGSPSNSFDQEIMVILTNSRDSSPMIAEEFEDLEINLPEDHPVGMSNPFASIRVTNADDVLGPIVYSIRSVNQASPGNIAVNPDNGDLYLNGSLDFDVIGNPTTFLFEVIASTTLLGFDSVSVTVRVTDVNDNTPFLSCLSSGSIPCPDPASPFTQLTFTVTSDLTETQTLVLRGEDEDRTAENSDFEISISSLPVPGVRFNSIGSSLFLLSVAPADVSNGTIPITIRNTACPLLSSSATVEIIVPQ